MNKVFIYVCLLSIIYFGVTNSIFGQDDVLVHADEMPYFIGCNDIKDDPEGKRKCSNHNLVSFISTNLEYPKEAKSQSLEGTVIISFVITKEGYVLDPFILKDIGGGCGEEALGIVKSMPRWEPGVHKGKKVNVKLNLPIKFNLSRKGVSSKYRILWGDIKGKTITKKQIKANLYESFVVRGPFGEDVPVTEVVVAYERKKKFLDAVGQGKITIEQKKLLKRVRNKGVITLSATLQVDGKFIEVDREFTVIK